MIAVPSRSLWRPRKRRLAPPPPPPIGTGLWMPEPDPSGYPAPSSYPNGWLWVNGGVVTGSPTVTYQNNQITGFPPTTSGVQQANSGVASTQTGGSINGVAAITYASSACMVSTNINPVWAQFSWFIVVKPSGTLTNTWLLNSDSFVEPAIFVNSSTKWAVECNTSVSATTIVGPTATAGTGVIVSATLNGAGLGTLYINGTSVGSATLATPSSAGASPVYLLNYQAGSVMAGVVGDVYLTTDCKTGNDLLNIHRYFGTKYGISVP
jgi:hypothetical protein